MWPDPIVQEVRDAGDKLAREVDYDLHRLCQRVQEHERKYADRLVRFAPRRLCTPSVARTQPATNS